MAKEQIDRSRRVEELGLARKIMNVLSRKADELANSGTLQQGNFHLEPAERIKLLEINNLGLKEGVAAGLLSLVMLRRIRASMIRRLWTNSQASGHHGPPPAAPPPNATTNNPFRNNSPFQQPNQQSSQFNPPPPLTSPPPPLSNAPPKQSTFMFLFGWSLDLLGAFSVMVTVSFIMTDMRKILDKLSGIPLTEGRSTVSREFCPDVVRAVRKIRAEDADAAAVLDDAQTKQLQAVLQFAENCQRRASYEAQLRRDKGVGRHYPVDVPPPGVPPDFPISGNEQQEQDGGGDDDDTQFGNNGGYDFYDPREETDNSQDWADDLTTDREDDRKS